jgi:hypothetical protein
MLTTAYSTQRFGSWNDMHNNYFFGTYALVARVMAVTFPRLSIIDAAWTTTYGPSNLTWVQNTKMLLASTDPVASSWYAAKFILTPIARYPNQTNPDYPSGIYNVKLTNWTTFLHDSAGFACTKDSSEISVYNRDVLSGQYIRGDANGDGVINSADIAYLINYLFVGGPVPQPYPAGDTNCDGIINSADVAYLINYLFVGGPTPSC